jgi:hypothetical protein
MITGALKSRIDSLWTDFWTGGITNPLTFTRFRRLGVSGSLRIV